MSGPWWPTRSGRSAGWRRAPRRSPAGAWRPATARAGSSGWARAGTAATPTASGCCRRLPPTPGCATPCVRVNPAIPWWLVPQGPDFAADRGSTQGFVGPDVLPEVTERIRAILAAHRGLGQEDFPLHPGPLEGPVRPRGHLTRRDGVGRDHVVRLRAGLRRQRTPADHVRRVPGQAAAGRRLGQVAAGGAAGDPAGAVQERLAAGAHETALRLAGLAAEVATVLSDDPRFRPGPRPSR